MKWPQLINNSYVLVGLKIEHPAFGILDVDRIQRKKPEIEELVKALEKKDKSVPFKYNSDYYSVVRIEHFPKSRIDAYHEIPEFYYIFLDWTGY